MQSIKDAFAFTIYFFTEAIPLMFNAPMGAIGELLDTIGYAKAIVSAFIAFIGIVAAIIISKIFRD